MISDYGKIWHWTHVQMDELKNTPGLDVSVQEKIDGSQFAFLVTKDGTVQCRSRNKHLSERHMPKMFSEAVKHVTEQSDLLEHGYTYRGEVVSSQKHNILIYERVPKGKLVLFDVDAGNQHYLPHSKVVEIAELLGIEPVREIYSGPVPTEEQINKWLDEEKSMLGAEKIEGVVIKPVNQKLFDKNGKLIKAKLVRADFQETHKKEWKQNDGKGFVQELGESLCTEARWHKAIQRMRDDGDWTCSAQDIGELLNIIKQDIVDEEAEYIKQKLYDRYSKEVLRAASRGFPEWYKQQLQEGHITSDWQYNEQ